MFNKFILRCAEEKDLSDVIRLFVEDDLGAAREILSDPLLQSYKTAFQDIITDKFHYLLVVEFEKKLLEYVI